MTTIKQAIRDLEAVTPGLKNDERYWDIRRTYGDYSAEVLRHLRACARARTAWEERERERIRSAG